MTPAAAAELQRLAGNRATLAVVQRAAAGRADVAVQRAVRLYGKDATANRKYLTDPGGGAELIASPNAGAPAPRQLYDGRDDTASDGTPVVLWTPRARLVHPSVPREEQDRRTAASGASGVTDKDMQEINDSVLRPLTHQIERLVDLGADDDEERIGTVGWNDCGGWARTLQILIGQYRDELEESSLVGTTWEHLTDKAKSDFPYHYATVVAADGEDAVTLEAHAGQKELTAPKFHIYKGGITGFERKNLENYRHYSRQARVAPQVASEDDLAFQLRALKEQWKTLELGQLAMVYSSRRPAKQQPAQPPTPMPTGIVTAAAVAPPPVQRQRRLKLVSVLQELGKSIKKRLPGAG